MLEVIDNAEKGLENAKDRTKFEKIKLKVGLAGVRFLISSNDDTTLNVIWNEVIKFTDQLRYDNAKEGNNTLFETLKKINSSKDT